jgi:hypothetical protein
MMHPYLDRGGQMLDTVRKFFGELKKDESIQESLKGTTDTDAFAAKAVQIGQQKGLSFSIEDVKEFLHKAMGGGELTEAQLDAVAGGGGGDEDSPYGY